MAARKIGNASVAIPLPNGKRKYVNIGAILEFDNNDGSKGLPYMLMLDPWIDLATLYTATRTEGDAIPVSFYKDTPRANADYPPRDQPPASRKPSSFNPDDDDVPY